MNLIDLKERIAISPAFSKEECDFLLDAINAMKLRELTAIQAEDAALWAPGRSIDHAYCQQALRFLTNAIEGDWTFEQAKDAIREMMP